MKTKDYVIIAILTSLMCVLSPISIPLGGGIPLSLATFVVMLIAVLLKQYKSLIVIALYILIALMGIPVLSGYGAGADRLFGITGGYIFGYFALAFFTGLFADISKDFKLNKRIIYLILGMVIGTIGLYTIGTIWFIFFTKSTLSAALMACVIPFIPGDLIKMLVVLLISPRLEKLIK